MAGQNGLTHVKSEVTYRNGKEVSRVIVQETVQTKPVTQLVIRGVDRTIMEQPADPEPAEPGGPCRLFRHGLRQLLVRLVVLRRLTL